MAKPDGQVCRQLVPAPRIQFFVLPLPRRAPPAHSSHSVSSPCRAIATHVILKNSTPWPWWDSCFVPMLPTPPAPAEIRRSIRHSRNLQRHRAPGTCPFFFPIPPPSPAPPPGPLPMPAATRCTVSQPRCHRPCRCRLQSPGLVPMPGRSRTTISASGSEGPTLQPSLPLLLQRRRLSRFLCPLPFGGHALRRPILSPAPGPAPSPQAPASQPVFDPSDAAHQAPSLLRIVQHFAGIDPVGRPGLGGPPKAAPPCWILLNRESVGPKHATSFTRMPCAFRYCGFSTCSQFMVFAFSVGKLVGQIWRFGFRNCCVNCTLANPARKSGWANCFSSLSFFSSAATPPAASRLASNCAP